MSRFRGPRDLMICSISPKVLPTMLLALLSLAGCESPAGPQTDSGAAHADPHQVPFHEGEKPPGPGDASASQDSAPNPAPGLPFRDAQNLPAGTLLTVRLKNPISTENPGSHAKFEGVVDEPVVVAGSTLVPRGVTVAGRVESAQASNLRRNRGYVRLALDSIQLGGASLPIQTSSLFVRGTAADVHADVNPAQNHGPQAAAAPSDVPSGESSAAAVISLEKGRRLTFRLTEPVYVAASQRTQADQ